jgi:excisionase family DNA binding protein
MHFLRPAEVAKRLGLSKWTVLRYIDQGKLRKVQVSPRVIYVEPESLKELFGETLIRRAFPELYESEPKEVE